MLSTIVYRIFTFHLKTHCTDLIESMNGNKIHQTLNHLTINVWNAMLQTFYKLNPKSIWYDLPQTFTISSKCVRFSCGEHFEHQIWTFKDIFYWI